MATQETIILYVILGLNIGMIYALRRMYLLERDLAMLNSKIGKLLTNKKKAKKR